MYCGNCGSMLSDGDVFCKNCGVKCISVEENKESIGNTLNESSKESFKKRVILLALIGIGLVMIIVGVMFARSPKRKLSGVWEREAVISMSMGEQRTRNELWEFKQSGVVEIVDSDTGRLYDKGSWAITNDNTLVLRVKEDRIDVEAEYSDKAKAKSSKGSGYWYVDGSTLYIEHIQLDYTGNGMTRFFSSYWILIVSIIFELIIIRTLIVYKKLKRL